MKSKYWGSSHKKDLNLQDTDWRSHYAITRSKIKNKTVTRQNQNLDQETGKGHSSLSEYEKSNDEIMTDLLNQSSKELKGSLAYK